MKLAVVAVCAAIVIGGQGVDPQKVPGSWKPFPASLQRPYQSPVWLTPAIVKDFGAHVAEVIEVLHRTPFLASPVGWVMFPHAELYLDRSWTYSTRTDPRWLVAARVKLWASHFESDGKTVYDTGSEFGLNLSANDLTCALNNEGAWATDADGAMFLEVEPPAESMHGFPQYQQCVLITHRPGPMFVPVALERVIKLRIAEIDKRLAPVRGMAGLEETVTALDQVLTTMRERLARLTPEQRRGPAFAATSMVLDDPLNFESGRRIVQANPAFFDAARPSDIQVLTIFDDCVQEGCPSGAVVAKVAAQLDWNALAALVR